MSLRRIQHVERPWLTDSCCNGLGLVPTGKCRTFDTWASVATLGNLSNLDSPSPQALAGDSVAISVQPVRIPARAAGGFVKPLGF